MTAPTSTASDAKYGLLLSVTGPPSSLTTTTRWVNTSIQNYRLVTLLNDELRRIRSRRAPNMTMRCVTLRNSLVTHHFLTTTTS